MADTRARDVIRLPAETKRSLEEQIPNMESLRHALSVMNELGMDTTKIAEQLDWAEKAAKLMLKEFG